MMERVSFIGGHFTSSKRSAVAGSGVTGEETNTQGLSEKHLNLFSRARHTQLVDYELDPTGAINRMDAYI